MLEIIYSSSHCVYNETGSQKADIAGLRSCSWLKMESGLELKLGDSQSDEFLFPLP